MTALLHLGMAPLATVLLTLWAGLVALSAEGDPRLPRALTVPVPGTPLVLAAPRGLHLVHLALLLLAAAAGGTAVAWWAWPPGSAAVRLLTTVALVWVVGDLLPRVIASILPRELQPALTVLGQRALLPFRPLLRLMARFDGQGAAPQAEESGMDRTMVAGVFALRNMTVAEVMTPRIDIVSVDVAIESEAVEQVFRGAAYSRLLVVDGHADAVAGVLHAKDFLHALHSEEETDWRALVQPVSFVPEAKTLDRQLRDVLAGSSHLAVVVDEFGGTAGLITLEDILEQIVGEIHDERDVDEVEPIQQDDDGVFRVQGGVALTELETRIGRDLGRDDVDTVGGWVLAALGRVPRVGDEVVENGVRCHVDQVVRRRVKRVTLTVTEDPSS